MPLEKGQRVLPTVSGPADGTLGAPSRPMTSKQARKAYLDRTRGPKMSKEEQRSEERRLQAEIRRDIKRRDQEEKKAQEREKAQVRAKAQRDRAKAKEEAERAAKRKAGKPLKPPRPSQATILGFMRGNGTAGKRAPAQDPVESRLPVIAEASASPASSAGSLTKRRRISETEATDGDARVPLETEAAKTSEDARTPEDACPASPEEDAAECDAVETDDSIPRDISTTPEAPREQETWQDQTPRGQDAPEPEPRTSSPTPVSSPRALTKGQNPGLAISFSIDDFEDALASSTQLDEEMQDPENTPVSDAAAEDTAPLAPRGEQRPPVGRGAAPKLVSHTLPSFLPFLSTQDCSLSEADISEIETPASMDRRGWRSDMGAPRIRPDTGASPILRTPSRPAQPVGPTRPPLGPVKNLNSRLPRPGPRISGPLTGAAASGTQPPSKVAGAAKLSDEDLSALQSEDWDDDLGLGKGPSPRPARRPAAAAAAVPGQVADETPPSLRLSSSDIRTLTSIDWEDDF